MISEKIQQNDKKIFVIYSVSFFIRLTNPGKFQIEEFQFEIISYLFFSLLYVKNKEKHYFSPLSLENQQKWLQFSEIIVGRHNLTILP